MLTFFSTGKFLLDFITFSKFFLAFSGDISCDFESAQWDTGFCNWQYDFSSTNLLNWVEASSTDFSIKEKWKYGMTYNLHELTLY